MVDLHHQKGRHLHIVEPDTPTWHSDVYLQFHAVTVQGCSKQAALKEQDLPGKHLVHHELESIFISAICVITVQVQIVIRTTCHSP